MDTESLVKSLNENKVTFVVIGATFEKVWKNKVKGKICGQDVFFASLDDLIKMKKAAGREKDKEDLRVLRKLKRKGG